jgi:cell wall-associated NlpC family hydrolase
MITPALDPNLNPFRDDLAAIKLKALVDAPTYVEPTTYQVSAGVTALRKTATEDGEQLSQALHGDVIDIYEEKDGFGWGQMLSDGYVGWFDMVTLSRPVLPVTRKVSALRTYAYADPSPKAPPHYLLSLGALVCETGERANGFVKCDRAGWVYEAHLADLNDFQSDPVTIAEQFLGAPYQWGGVESLGLDCSGLVQTSFKAAGFDMPRDSYMQRRAGEEVFIGNNLAGLKRGDIICWAGHVALMLNETDIIHANAFHLKVAREPLVSARARIAGQYGDILTVRRLVASVV